ncbi:hypothetical protein AURDEDRAFT_166700 [Auricularia subglabra TFB-10046 SS5]|nr:hypothetical protein AURDEDRAFT_166700 [Auricularia subglabra TFB-10046 SS5]
MRPVNQVANTLVVLVDNRLKGVGSQRTSCKTTFLQLLLLVEDTNDNVSNRGEASDSGAESDVNERASGAGRKHARHSALTGKRRDPSLAFYLLPSVLADDSGSETEEEQTARRLDIGRAVPLKRPEPRRNPAAQPQQVQPPAQPPAQPEAAQQQQEPAEPAAPLVCTPYTRRTNPAKKEETLDSSYTPPSKAAVLALKWTANAYVATQNAFFEQDDIDKFLKPLLLDLLRKDDAGKKNRIARQSDPFYIPDILRHVRSEASKIRNHALNIARNIIKDHYELVFRKPPTDPETVTQRLDRVRDLLNQSKFTALDTTTGLGLFEHPAIHELIYSTFFDSDAPKFNLAVNERCADAFKSYPNALIAFSASMIYAALSEWATGTLRKVKFNARQNGSAYQGLLAALERVTTGVEESRAFDAKRAAWYKAAIKRAGFRPAFDMGDDMDDIILRSRAALRAQARSEAQATSAGGGEAGAQSGNEAAQNGDAGAQNGGPN